MDIPVFRVGSGSFAKAAQVNIPQRWSKARILLPANVKVVGQQVLPTMLTSILAEIEQARVCLYSSLFSPNRPRISHTPEFNLMKLEGNHTAWISTRQAPLPHHIRSRATNPNPAFYERFNPKRFFSRASQRDVFLLLTRQTMDPSAPDKDVLAFAMIYCKSNVDTQVKLPAGIYFAADQTSRLRGIPFELQPDNTRHLSIKPYFFVTVM